MYIFANFSLFIIVTSPYSSLVFSLQHSTAALFKFLLYYKYRYVHMVTKRGDDKFTCAINLCSSKFISITMFIKIHKHNETNDSH